MKKLLLSLTCLFVLSQVNAADTELLTQKSRAAIKMLGSELKKTLQASMQANGVIETLSVCNIEAPKITDQVSLDQGMTVSRTSLKYRNPKNKPDDWQKSVLNRFEQRKQSGEAVDSLEYSEITELNGKQVFRYMKAIPTGDMCLNCHGENVAQPFVSKINALYTDDKAIGFKKGDIRGAFSVIQVLD